jgi:hypothetical protein
VYPSSFKDLLKICNKELSFSTSNADLREAFMLLGGGKGGSGGSGYGRKCAIFLLRSKKLLIN